MHAVQNSRVSPSKCGTVDREAKPISLSLHNFGQPNPKHPKQNLTALDDYRVLLLGGVPSSGQYQRRETRFDIKTNLILKSGVGERFTCGRVLP